ncbi:AsmA family protein [Winogradskyella ursingii]|uniref:hypothetical protein n=1 Tax=Winogradskyella ursingii TaxID=2686079 RepID=UPI0015CA0B8E|nr:hypothetical protein [Winogradskyella ursingii]
MKLYLYRMQKKYKKKVLIVGVVILFLILAYFIVNSIAKNRIENYVKNLPDTIKVDYSDIDVSIIGGDLEITSPKIFITGKTTGKTILDANLEKINIEDVSIWSYLFSDKISIQNINLNQPNISFYYNKNVDMKDLGSSQSNSESKPINIDNFNINDANVIIYNTANDSIKFSANALNFNMKSIQIDSTTKNQIIPFEYETFNLNGNALFFQMSDYENLTAKTYKITDTTSLIEDIKLKTKYSRQRLSQIIPKERDHFDVVFESLKIENQSIDSKNDSVFSFGADKLILESADATIYRDKLVNDDNTYKPLYSKMLRDLEFDLGIDSVKVNNAKLTYAEKVKADNKAGEIHFTNFDAIIAKVGNVYGTSEPTKINVNTSFMGSSPLNVDWSFTVQDPSDRFVFKADLGFLNVPQLNEFTEPNLNVQLEGDLQQTYFTISGNPSTSSIDLKMKYDEFKVALMKDDGKEEKNFLSGIVNLFVSKDSDGDEDGFRFGHAEGVERNTNQSIFNFIWISTKAGLRSAVAGDGDKAN